MLEAICLEKFFTAKVKVIKKVSLEVKPNQIVGFWEANGNLKTITVLYGRWAYCLGIEYFKLTIQDIDRKLLINLLNV